MQQHSKLSYAIAAILGGGAFGSAAAANSTDANLASDQIQEITVTAQRRSENVQNVPIAIQALTGETLTQLNVTTFDDLIKYLPNVTAPTAGPGQARASSRAASLQIIAWLRSFAFAPALRFEGPLNGRSWRPLVARDGPGRE